MNKFKVPTELIEMANSRRVIPFIGAGFSAGLNLPDWDTLLSKIADDLDDNLSYSDVKGLCNNDPLQIAEYYYLKCDGSIGPIRHAISSALRNDINPVYSASHIELINLGAPQIYTTNYDDLDGVPDRVPGTLYLIQAR